MCIFCEKIKNLQYEYGHNKNWVVMRDEYPVTFGHRLVIPKVHIKTWDELMYNSIDLHYCIKTAQFFAKEEDNTITGFNIGINLGVDAGQSVEHIHIHVIPRRNGDVENPRGGVRNVIPGMGDY